MSIKLNKKKSIEDQAFDDWYDKQIELKKTDELDRDFIDNNLPAYEEYLKEKFAEDIREFEKGGN